MSALVAKLRNLNCSNTLDSEEHNWGALMNCLNDALDPECDDSTFARRLKREGITGKDELMQIIECRVETRIAVMQVLLRQVKNLK